MMKHLVLALVFFVNTSALHSATPDSTSLKSLHFELFDSYFPDSNTLTPLEKKQRAAYRQQTWVSLKDTPILKQLIGSFPQNKPVQEHLNTLLKSGDKGAQKLAFMIRKFYLNVCYDDRISLPLAHVKTSKRLISKARLSFPKSKLHVKSGALLHKQGDIDYLRVIAKSCVWGFLREI